MTKHGVDFEEASTVFEDPFAVDAPDVEIPRRFVLIGNVANAAGTIRRRRRVDRRPDPIGQRSPREPRAEEAL